jgi:hypothetical protein
MALSPSNNLTGSITQSLEPATKRLKMSSVNSESTIASDTADSTTTGQISLSVASEDLSNMMFHVADLQRVTNSWVSHHPLTGAEAEMKASFKACEDTANSLRDTLEALEANAASLVSIPEAEFTAGNLHDSTKNNSNNDNDCSAYSIKFVASLTMIRVRVLTAWKGRKDLGVPHQGWHLENCQSRIHDLVAA